MFQLGRVEILGTASGAPRALRIGVIPIDPLGERLPPFGCTDQRDLNTLRVNRVARKSAWFMSTMVTSRTSRWSRATQASGDDADLSPLTVIRSQLVDAIGENLGCSEVHRRSLAVCRIVFR
jgi:hypothetical protein